MVPPTVNGAENISEKNGITNGSPKPMSSHLFFMANRQRSLKGDARLAFGISANEKPKSQQPSVSVSAMYKTPPTIGIRFMVNRKIGIATITMAFRISIFNVRIELNIISLSDNFSELPSRRIDSTRSDIASRNGDDITIPNA